ATTLSYVVRAARWPIFFNRNVPSFVASYRCLILGFFMNNVLPARIGELVRAHIGGRETSNSRTYVLATIAGERLADGLMISVLFAALFTLGASERELSEGREIFIVAFLFGLVSLLTAFVLAIRQTLFGWIEALGRVMPGHLSSFTLIRIRRFIEGLEPMLEPRRVLKISILSLAVWLVELLVYFQVAKAFGVPMTIGGLALFLAAVNFSSLVPAAPGGIGVIEAFATTALRHIGVEAESAFAMVATQHLIQILVVGVPGAYFFYRNMGGRIPESNGELDVDEFLDQQECQMQLPRSRKHRQLASTDADSVTYAYDVSVVIPAYNEEARLPITLEKIRSYLSTRNDSFEVIVVNDGSADRTAEVVDEFKQQMPNLRLETYQQNRGKGYAVRHGMLAAQGRLVLYDDADGATPIEEIERLEKAFAAGADVAIGSRALYSRE
ncbi:MAG: flippase-like domain-containing protein, partial [Bdellovibrionales bacterium]|nr:flippase-like domain-containing protein [Bdellovibrionales bacterium]